MGPLIDFTLWRDKLRHIIRFLVLGLLLAPSFERFVVSKRPLLPTMGCKLVVGWIARMGGPGSGTGIRPRNLEASNLKASRWDQQGLSWQIQSSMDVQRHLTFWGGQKLTGKQSVWMSVCCCCLWAPSEWICYVYSLSPPTRTVPPKLLSRTHL